MSKTKLLTIFVVGLTILNIALMAALIWGKSKHPKKPRPKHIIIERLGFDEAQIASYEQLIEYHRTRSTEIQQSISKIKNNLFQTLQEEEHPQKDSLINILGKYQMDLEQLNFKHFNDTKAICRPDQLDKFKALSKDLERIFIRKKKK